MLVSGPCLEETDEITCMFGERSVTGIYISEMLLLCVSPTISTTGRVRFQLIVQTNGTSTDRYRGESVFYSGEHCVVNSNNVIAICILITFFSVIYLHALFLHQVV